MTVLATGQSPLLLIIAGTGDRQTIVKLLTHWKQTAPPPVPLILLSSPANALEHLEDLSSQDMPVVTIGPGETALAAGQVYLADVGTHVHLRDDSVIGENRARNDADDLSEGILVSQVLSQMPRQTILVVLRSKAILLSALIDDIRSTRGIAIVESGEEDGATPLAADIAVPSSQLPEAINQFFISHVSAHEEPSIVPTLQQIADITAIVSEQTGVDFSEYKTPTLIRRIQRRLKMHALGSIPEYIDILRHSKEEIDLLHKDLLIGITRFFRDHPAFNVLREQVIPVLVARDTEKSPIRIWVAGCSTGEEVYSLAIQLAEAFDAAGKRINVRLFATDIDKAALVIASNGVYSEEHLARMTPQLRDRYFVKRDNRYQISGALRDLIIFASHNMIKDPPFHRLDLITCRNVLIYLKPLVQQRLLRTFHFSLVPNGVLLLGNSEYIGDISQLFEKIDGTVKIYQKNPDKRSVDARLAAEPYARSNQPRALPLLPRSLSDSQPSTSLQEAINQTLLKDFILNFVIVDDSFEVRHVFGDLEHLLMLPQGRPNLNIIKMVSPEMAIALSTGIRQSISRNEIVTFDDVATMNPKQPKTRIVIRPFMNREFGKLAVVIFEVGQAGDASTGTPFDYPQQLNQRIKDLEWELEHTSDSLRTALEELETTNEEMQATNEEVMASKEELQSSNEELLSVNQELNSVNGDYRSKILELVELNNDILNSLASSNIGSVFLDANLHVRKFTKSVVRQINLIESDIGRPLEHLTNNIAYPNLALDARRVLTTLVPVQCDVRTDDGQPYAMRIFPYRTDKNEVKGVVVTFVDLPPTSHCAASDSTPPALLLRATRQGVVESVNEAFARITGWSGEDLAQSAAPLLCPDEAAQAVYRTIAREIAGGRPWSGRLWIQSRTGGRLEVQGTIFLSPGAGTGVDHVIAMGAPTPA